MTCECPEHLRIFPDSSDEDHEPAEVKAVTRSKDAETSESEDVEAAGKAADPKCQADRPRIKD